MSPRGRTYWDEERGMTVIRRSPEARHVPTPDEVKEWHQTGVMPQDMEEFGTQTRAAINQRLVDALVAEGKSYTVEGGDDE